jgi:hypothetical protein
VRSTNNETPVEPFGKLRAGSPEYLPSTLYGVIVKFGEPIARGYRVRVEWYVPKWNEPLFYLKNKNHNRIKFHCGFYMNTKTEY